VFGIVVPLATVGVPVILDADGAVGAAAVGVGARSVAVGAPDVGDALPLLHAASAVEAAAAVMSVKNRLRVSIAASDCIACSSLILQARRDERIFPGNTNQLLWRSNHEFLAELCPKLIASPSACEPIGGFIYATPIRRVAPHAPRRLPR